MIRDRTFFRSKIARRFFLVFVCCALVPMFALTYLSFRQVTSQLKSQSHKRLQEQTKAYGMSIYERLLLLDADLDLISTQIRLAGQQPDLSEIFDERLEQRFKALVLNSDTKGHLPLFRDIAVSPALDLAEKENLGQGKTVITTLPDSGKPARLFMLKPLPGTAPATTYLIGEMVPSYVWGIGYENYLPSQTALFVLDMKKKVLVSSHPPPEELIRNVMLKQNGNQTNQFEYRHNDHPYLASYWSIFLKSRFFAQSWTVVLGQSKDIVLQPMEHFSKIFPLVFLLSLWIVLLLSIVLIKKTLAPVEVLKEGTRRVAAKDFKTRVAVDSGDEFEEFAASFNTMTQQLDQQFKAMTTRAGIDRAILSSLDSKTIISTALIGMDAFFESELISFSLLTELQENSLQEFSIKDGREKTPAMKTIQVRRGELAQLEANPHSLHLTGKDPLPSYLIHYAEKGISSFLVVPVFLRKKLAGFITLGCSKEIFVTDEMRTQARHFADQLAVALSNARLIEDMEHLTLGTIEALARTVDAKSHWTSGHSQRVADMATDIAKAMGWPDEEIEIIYRGGLLHDIGKIGVPIAILDKPGRLSDEEYRKVQDHSAIGARILEPISAYADVIPMVLQHHERYDGKGYPNGLSGKEIDPKARILAVADVYDALISNRPYRQGWIQDKVVTLLKNEAGSQFDPEVVEAFLGILGTSSMKGKPAAG